LAGESLVPFLSSPSFVFPSEVTVIMLGQLFPSLLAFFVSFPPRPPSISHPQGECCDSLRYLVVPARLFLINRYPLCLGILTDFSSSVCYTTSIGPIPDFGTSFCPLVVYFLAPLLPSFYSRTSNFLSSPRLVNRFSSSILQLKVDHPPDCPVFFPPSRFHPGPPHVKPYIKLFFFIPPQLFRS